MEQKIAKTEEVIKKLLDMLKIEAELSHEIKDDEDGKYIIFNVAGDNASELIGYHGRNIDAFQTVLSMMLKENDTDEANIVVDINGYKEKRSEYIRSIGERAIMEVLDTKQEMELAPMKAYERRIIHMMVKENPELSSESIGMGEDRRIIIKLK